MYDRTMFSLPFCDYIPVSKLRENGDVYDKDGAVWFRSSKYGDEKDRVVIKSDGGVAYRFLITPLG